MAINNLANYKQTDGFGMSLNIRRGNPNPLDNSELYSSLAQAQEYAKNDPTAYVGQTIKVLANNRVATYIITNVAGNLERVITEDEFGGVTGFDSEGISTNNIEANEITAVAVNTDTIECTDFTAETLNVSDSLVVKDVNVTGSLTWQGDEVALQRSVDEINEQLEGLTKTIPETYETKKNANEKLAEAKKYAEEYADDSAQFAQQKAKEYTDAEIATLKTYLENEDTGLQNSIDEVASAVAELEENGMFIKSEGEGSIASNYGTCEAVSEGAVAIGTEMVKSAAALDDVQNTVAGSKAFRYTSRALVKPDDEYRTTFTIDGDVTEFFTVGTICYVITNSDHAGVGVTSVYYNSDNDYTTVTFNDEFAADPATGWEQDAPYKKTIQIVGRPDLGNVDIGMYAFAQGLGNQAIGYASVAMGRRNVVESAYGTAFGRNNKARFAAFVEGNGNEALGDASHAEGNGTKVAAGANYAHAEGQSTQALKNSAHAEGYNTKASGTASHAEGSNTEAIANYSHASGLGTRATREAQTAVGTYNLDAPNALFVVGNGTSSSATSNALTVDEGGTTTVKQLAVSGVSTFSSTIKPVRAAIGYELKTTGSNSLAQGAYSEAKTNYSVAAGLGTITSRAAQMAVGTYNAEDTNALFVVGAGGSATSRKNAFTVESQAAYVAGKKILVEGAESIKIGNTTLTEAQLLKILNFIESVEIEGGDNTFTIDRMNNGSPTTYQFEAGMTWAEWVASDYNTDGYTIDRTMVYIDSEYISGVSKSDQIIAKEAYHTWE